MGFSISWVAVQGIPKEEFLAAMSLRDTGEPDEWNETDISGTQLPDGWYLAFFNKYDHSLTRTDMLEKLSAGGRLLCARIEEHVMASSAAIYEKGALVWSVSHNAQQGLYDLENDGAPPAAFEAIHDRLKSEQNDQGGEDANVDYIFDIPVELAAHVCGYRHDKAEFEWGAPQFSQLVPVSAAPKRWWNFKRG